MGVAATEDEALSPRPHKGRARAPPAREYGKELELRGDSSDTLSPTWALSMGLGWRRAGKAGRVDKNPSSYPKETEVLLWRPDAPAAQLGAAGWTHVQ